MPRPSPTRRWHFRCLPALSSPLRASFPSALREVRPGEYTFSIFAVVTIALIVSWFVAVLFTPLLGVWLLKAPEQRKRPSRADHAGFPQASFRSDAGALADDWHNAACFVAALLRLALCRAPVFSSLGPARAAGRSETSAECLDLCQRGCGRQVRRHSSRAIPMSELEHLCRPGSDPLLPSAQRPARERLLLPGGHHCEGFGSAGPASKKLETTLPETFPSAISRVTPLELGPPVGWPVQYRVVVGGGVVGAGVGGAGRGAGVAGCGWSWRWWLVVEVVGPSGGGR